MINEDTSDWDPLPAAETGWHPGEAPKSVPAVRTQPSAPTSAVPQQAQPPSVAGPAAVPENPRPSRRPGLRNAPPMLPAVRIELGARAALAVTPNESVGRESRVRPQAADLASLMKVEAPTQARKPGTVFGVPVATSVAVPRPRPADALPAPLPPGVDIRERETWFQQMPVVEQVRLRRAWQEIEAAAPGALLGTRSQQLLERFWVAYVVFFVAALPLMLTEGLAGFVRMAMAGCVTGMVWQVVPHTRRLCAASAVGVYVAVAMLPRVGELFAQPFDLLVSVGGAVIVGYLSALGAGHERRPVEVVEAD